MCRHLEIQGLVLDHLYMNFKLPVFVSQLNSGIPCATHSGLPTSHIENP